MTTLPTDEYLLYISQIAANLDLAATVRKMIEDREAQFLPLRGSIEYIISSLVVNAAFVLSEHHAVQSKLNDEEKTQLRTAILARFSA